MTFNIKYTEKESDDRDSGELGKSPTIIYGNDASIDIVRDGDILEVLPLRNMVFFPSVLMPVQVARAKSRKLIEKAYKHDQIIAVLTQKDKEVNDPQDTDLYTLGIAARVVQMIPVPNGDGIMAIVEGLYRIRVNEFITSRNGLKVQVSPMPEEFPSKSDKVFLALVSNVKDQAAYIIEHAENLPVEAGMFLRSIENTSMLINYICVNLGLSTKVKQSLLGCDSLSDRAWQLLEIMNKEIQMMKMKEDIQSKTKEDIDKQQREYFLHQQMETIQKELGDTGAQVMDEMRQRAAKKQWSQTIQEVFDKSLERLQRTPSHAPDYTTELNYIETLLSLPWNEVTEDNYDIAHAQQVLDSEHYGMEKVKERIIEYLAVQRQLSLRSEQQKKEQPVPSPILCLYGPPGVGKTSLGRSIATALGRKYARVSLGGLHDEAEIRGHRKTYVGAMPGRIIENIAKCQSSNPIFVLDEIDKIGADYKGDPTSALLEVLDPEQNSTFHDNYLDTDYDLSKVLFIATANTLETIPRPLLDRMELIEMTGYLQEEKEEIAKRHLLPKCLRNHGLTSAQLRLKKDIVGKIIENYTRESGVRSLERQIAAICRKVDTRLSLGEEYNVTVTPTDLISYLGQPRFTRDAWETNKYVGVVTGLAWTQVGGEILFIEASLSPSKTPTLTLTGNLGDVMKESATLALGYIKAHADEFGIKRRDLDTQSVHIHVPEGAIPKDGPSAGITMTTALVSAFTGRKVRARIAMTGEMTLRGKVLPIGGVKEKILAAKRAGIHTLILCEDNRKDVADIPEKYLQGLSFHYVQDIQEVIRLAIL